MGREEEGRGWGRGRRDERREGEKVNFLAAASARTHSLGAGAVPEPVVTHVLQDHLTMGVLISARVLIGPFNRQDRTLVVIQATHIVAPAVVVLRVKKPEEKYRQESDRGERLVTILLITCSHCSYPSLLHPDGCWSP